MKLLPDDPRLTAFALGEIEDAQERAAIEAAIRENPELQKAVREIQEMGNLLNEGLTAEPAPEVTEFEKARMEEGAADTPIKKRSVLAPILSWPMLSAGVAAVAVLGFIFLLPAGIMFQSTKDDAYIEPVTTIPAPNLPVAVPPPVEVDADKKANTFTDIEGSSEPVAELERQRLATELSPAPLLKEERENEVFEMSPFEVQTSADTAGYLATNSLSASRVASLPQPSEKMQTWNTEQYDIIDETGFRSPLVAPLSTFSIDVDTASYANVRRFLNAGQLPPADAVRIEEVINYFPYSDAPPTRSLDEGGDPFAVHMEQADAPWNSDHRLLRIALKGYLMPWEERPASNLVFLLDVSGSMNQPNKLPLLKEAMDMLVRRLDERDRVAIVVYAGASGLVLPSTSANNHDTISHALNQLSAGGSTNAGAGIELAYRIALDNFIPDGNNRVILCTDGDFNVGQTHRGTLADVAAEHADKGVSLSVLGFGMGNYKDGMLETLSNKGKGGYAYIDSAAEARKVFLEDLTSNLFTIARDVKIQVEFNPDQVAAYRLIGYENRRLKAEDFNDDKKKAGDIGPGHSVVAFYELVPAGTEVDLPEVDPLKYQSAGETVSRNGEVATVKLRYKLPEEETSRLITGSVEASEVREFSRASDDFRFGAAVAAFGMRLRESERVADFPYRKIESIAAGALGMDPGGHRSAFTGLVRKAEEIANREPEEADPSHTVNE